MKIAFFCSSRSIIPPLKTGGSEQSAYYLARGLLERGHEVTLYAAPGSDLAGARFKPVSPFPTFVKQKYANLQERITSFYDLMALSDFFASGESEEYDLIYYTNYIFYEILPFACQTRKPIIIRINYPHDLTYPYLKKRLEKQDNVHYLPISRFIKSVMPNLRYLDEVYTALDFADFPYSGKPGDYLLFIGRISPDKGAHLAVQTALQSERKLVIAGKVYDSHLAYFDEMIKPYVDGRKIIYLEEVDFERKIKLYQGAAATLFPIQWNEPTGSVMFESMACGTPVIAFDRAAVREIIKDGESGVIVPDGNVQAMAAAVPEVMRLDRTQVRVWAENNFSVDRWARRFEEICAPLVT